MKRTKTIHKCKRGQKLCGNSECRIPMPIHTGICKICGFINAKRANTKKDNTMILNYFFSGPVKTEAFNKKNINKLRNFLKSKIFEVSLLFLDVVAGSRPIYAVF